MNIIQRLIPASNTFTRPGNKIVPTFITIHETDNTAFKANAFAHARLQENGNNRQASWHLTVDDTYCYQSIPFDEEAYHAGTGARGQGNINSIAIEICVNSDGDYKKAVANAAEVTRQLMAQFKITVDHVVQHNHWSGKNCPSIMRSGKTGITWASFIQSLGQKGEEDMLAQAIVINGYSDFPAAEPLSVKLRCPIYVRNAIAKGTQVAKELIVVGGNKDGLTADKFTVLAGADRYETAAAVKKYLG
jgi:hypothetical protein